jgi:hypothetical protein
MGGKGWVYVISNKAMPGILKVGYSMKDPSIRAKELGGTGIPHEYEVDYEALVENPFQVEQQAHRSLGKFLEKKEWFRCSLDEAVLALKNACGDQLIKEFHRKSDRAKIEAAFAERNREQKRIEAERRANEQLISFKGQLESKWDEEIERLLSPSPLKDFFFSWVIFAPFGVVVIDLLLRLSGFFSEKGLYSSAGSFFLAWGVVGLGCWQWLKWLSQNLPSVKKAREQKANELSQLEIPDSLCQECNTLNRIDLIKVMTSQEHQMLCGKCMAKLPLSDLVQSAINNEKPKVRSSLPD